METAYTKRRKNYLYQIHADLTLMVDLTPRICKIPLLAKLQWSFVTDYIPR